MATGGSIESVSLNGREFAVAADSDATIFMGGKSNEFRANGDGLTGRDIKTVMGWKVTGLELAIDWSAGDMTFLQDLSDGAEFAFTMTLADDTVLGGTGQLQGEFTGSTQSSTASVELSGPGKLIEQ